MFNWFGNCGLVIPDDLRSFVNFANDCITEIGEMLEDEEELPATAEMLYDFCHKVLRTAQKEDWSELRNLSKHIDDMERLYKAVV